MSVYTYKELISKANECKVNVATEQRTIISYKWSYYFAKALLTHKDVKKINIEKAPYPSKTNISRQMSKETYIALAKKFVTFVEKKHVLPNYLRYGKYKISQRLYTYTFARCLVYYNKHGRYDNEITINEKVFTKPTETTDKVFDYFIKVFGKVTTFTQALGKIQGKGYGYYFDDKLSNIQVIDGLKKSNGVKPNCVDICHMMWHIANQLGYDVRCLHVYCPVDKITHVRLQVKHNEYTNGKWENYDPAAVADGGAINKLWCAGSGSYIIATNPSWFKANINR